MHSGRHRKERKERTAVLLTLMEVMVGSGSCYLPWLCMAEPLTMTAAEAVVDRLSWVLA